MKRQWHVEIFRDREKIGSLEQKSSTIGMVDLSKSIIRVGLEKRPLSTFAVIAKARDARGGDVVVEVPARLADGERSSRSVDYRIGKMKWN